MGFKLAELFVSIGANASPLTAALAGVKGTLGGMVGMGGRLGGGLVSGMAGGLSAAAGRLNQALGMVAIGAGGAAAFGLYKAVQGASDLNETLSKTDAVLGDAAPAVKAFADDMARKFGLVKRETLDTASAFAGLGKGLGGLSGKSLSDFSIQFTKLAADLSSFANIGMGEAGEAIKTGLAGNQSDVLKGLGVVLLDSQVQAKAAALGFKKVNGEYAESAKLAARAALITRGLADASGDLDKTQGAAANQTRKFWGNLKNLGDSIGSIVMPAFTDFLALGNTVLNDLSAGFEKNKGMFEGWAATLSDGVETLGVLYRNFGDVVGLIGVNIAEGWLNISERLMWFKDNAGTVIGWFATNFTTIMVDAINGTMIAIENFADNFQEVFNKLFAWMKNGFQGPVDIQLKPILEGFKARTEGPKLTEFKGTSLDEEREKFTSNIMDREAKRLALEEGMDDWNQWTTGLAGKKGPDAAAAAGKEKGKSSDLVAFAKSLQEGTAKAQLSEAKRTNEKLDKLIGATVHKGVAAAAVAAVAVGPAF